jgi:cytochrome P450/NADPH-cytochrome P450 reductase
VTTQSTTYEPIPQPPGYPVLGNLFDVRGADTPIQGLMKLARQYGPIFRLRVGPRNLVVVSGFDLANEICDDERFDKMLGAGLIGGHDPPHARHDWSLRIRLPVQLLLSR